MGDSFNTPDTVYNYDVPSGKTTVVAKMVSCIVNFRMFQTLIQTTIRLNVYLPHPLLMAARSKFQSLLAIRNHSLNPVRIQFTTTAMALTVAVAIRIFRQELQP